VAAVLQLLTEAAGAVGAAYILSNNRTGEVEWASFCGPSVEFKPDYLTYYSALDPYRPIVSEVEPISVDVVALDWKWLFIYRDLHIATVNEIAFPVNVPVDFRITSASVMNSFFIPQLGSQIYAMAGMQTKLSLIANHAGSYDGISANYSGAGFSDMKFKAIAVSDQEFKDWIAKVKLSSRRLGFDAYKALANPSEKHPVVYFSSVDPALFQAILHEPRHKPRSIAMDHSVHIKE